jgi:phosphoacetylglucosamine mutase
MYLKSLLTSLGLTDEHLSHVFV